MPYIFLKSCCLLALFLFTSISSCNQVSKKINHPTNLEQDTIKSDLPNREQLFNQLYEKREVALIYPSESADYQKIAEQIAQESRWLKINLYPSDQLKEDFLKDNILYLMGTPTANPVIARFLEGVPIGISTDTLIFNQKNYPSQRTVASLAIYPNPLNTQLPLSIVTGANEQAIIDLLSQPNAENTFGGFSSFGYEVYQNQRRILMGFYDDQNWEAKPPAFDFSKGGQSVLTTAHFNFISENSPLTEPQIENYAAEQEAQIKRLQTFLKVNQSIPKLNYHLYPTAETKGLMTGSTERAHVNFTRNEAHVVMSEIYAENDIDTPNEWFLHQYLGKTNTRALEKGLAIHFTNHWQRKSYQYWAVRLYSSGNLPALTTLLNSKNMEEGSDLVLGASAGSFVDYLLLKWGKANFIKKYKNWTPTATEIIQLEKGWHQHLKKLISKYDNPIKRHPKVPYSKGFNFAHEGYNIYNGYGSQLATESLEKLKDMGTNAIAIVPYSYMRDPQKASPIPLIQHAGNENDEAVVHTAYMAKQKGMTVMLKPHIWLGRGEWPGSVEMQSEEAWQNWFTYYHDWILHYALLAEIHDMEFFCLGVEFVKATTRNPNQWRTLIKEIRGVYSGYLTYAANWGEEFETINFWDDLDYIGVNSYYPLSKAATPSKEELKKGFEKIAKKLAAVSEQYKKPLLFTEIGFRSIDMPWQNPHAEANGAPFNEEHQKMAYEVVFECIKDKTWCKGIYWWKFPTYLKHQGVKNTGFTPNHKGAEEVVRKYFRE